MKIGLGNEIIHLNRSAMHYFKNKSAASVPAANTMGSVISTSTLKQDGFEVLSVI